MNRRTFIQRCFAAAGGVYVAFAPGKAKPDCSPIIPAYTGVENSIEPSGIKYKWRRWDNPNPSTEPLCEGIAPFNPYKAKGIIINDDFVQTLKVGNKQHEQT